jgi:CBS domain-containing protein
MIGGLAVGLGGLVDPSALGVGYDVIQQLLAGHIPATEAGRLLLVKAVIWIIALSSGTSGGVLAPLLIMGGALGSLEGLWLPGGPAFWALIGMAATMGGTMRAPLTGALFAVELTGDVSALLPLLAACGAAYGTTVLLLKRSILTEKIARRGVHISREYSVDPFQLLQVSDIMVDKVESLPAAMPVDQAIAFFTGRSDGGLPPRPGGARRKSYPIVDAEGRVVGLAPRAEVLRWMTEGDHQDQTLGEVISDAGLLLGRPEEMVGRLAERMVERDTGRVPIVDERGRLVGLVTRKDLLRVHARQRAQETDRTAAFRPARRVGLEL